MYHQAPSLVPASAERAEQVDQGDLPLGAAVDEGDLVEEAAALRIEVAQVVVDATS